MAELNIGFFDALNLLALFTDDGMARLKVVVDGAQAGGRDAVRRAVYAQYPFAEEVVEVALARDPEGAYQYILEVAEGYGGPLAKQSVINCRPYVYQIHTWLQGELDKPRPELGVGGRGSGVGGRG